jgi:adenylylsulfate kinase
MRPRKILIMGLPGAGKTTLARALSLCITKSIVYDGDEVRKATDHWDFTEAGRELQATRIGELCDTAISYDHIAIASFVCPTPATRDAFWGNTTAADLRFTIFVDRLVACPYPDTNKLFGPPWRVDYTVSPEETVSHSVNNIMELLQ